MQNLHAVIMAGGSGTRFWPASRSSRPKQYLPLAGGQSLLQATVTRMRALVPPERLWIATNPKLAASLPDVVPEVPEAQWILEPEARDTAPCIALATAAIANRDPNALILTAPADHLIGAEDRFRDAIECGAARASDNQSLVLFGLQPTWPATGFGYIECGERLPTLVGRPAAPAAFAVARFREKPDAATAAQYLASGRFLWNSGIFLWSGTAIRAAMQTSHPELATACESMLRGFQAGDRKAVDQAFATSPKTSIDYAVMERCPTVKVVAADFPWNDVGSFTAIGEITAADAAGNHRLLHNGAATLLADANNNLVYAEGNRTVALFGVQDLVVVAVGDAVLVCPRNRAADLKQVVQKLATEGRTDLL